MFTACALIGYPWDGSVQLDLGSGPMGGGGRRLAIGQADVTSQSSGIAARHLACRGFFFNFICRIY